MTRFSGVLAVLIILLVGFEDVLNAQNKRQRVALTRGVSSAASPLTGVYRIDVADSDKLYTVVEDASSNLPFGEQQRFFIDLAVRLTPPDLLALECRGNRVTVGSSRAQRVTFTADGVTHTARGKDGYITRSRVALENDKLTFTSSGRSDDNVSITFVSIDDGARLRVTRRISDEELSEPVVIQTVYNKIADVARWDIYGEPQVARKGNTDLPPTSAATAAAPRTGSVRVVAPKTRSAVAESDQADTLRGALNRWIDATNQRDIEGQVSFYAAQLTAFYLTRNASRAVVRAEKIRTFGKANAIDIRAETPEIIFLDGGQTALMRFRKTYRIDDRAKTRRGAVVQELRWRRTGDGWKIFSERDVKVIR